MAATSLPDRARVVIIGGGVIGTSVAYHLTKLGCHRRACCSSRANCPAAPPGTRPGWSGQLRASESATRLVQYSTAAVRRARERDRPVRRLQAVRGVTVARTEDRMIQLRRTAANAAAFDMECELLTPEQALEHYPVMQRRRPASARSGCPATARPTRPT